MEQNPFKTLLDITDLIEMEGPSATGGPKEIEKEVQNIMLRANSDLKNWWSYLREQGSPVIKSSVEYGGIRVTKVSDKVIKLSLNK